jgi:hypothetical protein
MACFCQRIYDAKQLVEDTGSRRQATIETFVF